MNMRTQEAKVARLAKRLCIPLGHQLVQGIVEYCHQKIQDWVPSAEEVGTIEDLEIIVCAHLNLTIIEVNTDAELDTVIKRYSDKGDLSFLLLRHDLDDSDTFAATIKHKVRKPGVVEESFVAIIDCRTAEKASRRFFTRWHEIAHLLTEHYQDEPIVFRSVKLVEKDPLERLMDRVAAKIGFYDPLFMPILRDEIEKDDRFSLQTIERIRGRYSREASFQATMIACISRLPFPGLYVEARMGLRKEERDQIDSAQLTFFPLDPPVEKLRAVNVFPNAAAKNHPDFLIHQNMQVPADSVIARAYDVDSLIAGDFVGDENLDMWMHSNGIRLPSVPLRISARYVGGSVYSVVLRNE